MAYNFTAPLGKSTSTDNVDFGKCQDRFGRVFWYKNDSNNLDVKLNVFKKLDNKEFQLVQNFTVGEADFNQFMQLRKQLVIIVENFAREENLSPVLIPTMSKDIDEQLKLAHNAVEVVARANRKICVSLVWYNRDKPENFHAQVRLYAGKKAEGKFQQFFHVKYKLEEVIYQVDVMKSVYDKVNIFRPICNVVKQVILSVYSLSFFFPFESGWTGTLEIKETSFSSENQKWKVIMLYLQLQKLLPKNLHWM